MSQAKTSGVKQVKLVCSRCKEASVGALASEGLHAFICPFCGQPHLLLEDANKGLRDLRPVSYVPVRRPFDVAQIKMNDETLIPSHLKTLLDSLKRGVLPLGVDETLELLMNLGLLEVDEGVDSMSITSLLYGGVHIQGC
ncbi:MAG: hypothetical protein NZ954_00380 [Thermofilaceae archaeon]|nr:hypothetical protein [Thermofilaceae archaeon]MCX8180364.1 hypothetical protein [Thermofilaceae archaeon]MDW8003899.1 hypothetical protein [Thermofilaceae archaeon]